MSPVDRDRRPQQQRRRTSFVAIVSLLAVGSLVALLRGQRASPVDLAAASTRPGTNASSGTGTSTGTASASASAGIYSAITNPVLSPKVARDPTYVYVPNGVPGTVEVIDPPTFEVVRT